MFITRLPYNLFFFPARMYSADKIELVSGQRNDSVQLPGSGVALS